MKSLFLIAFLSISPFCYGQQNGVGYRRSIQRIKRPHHSLQRRAGDNRNEYQSEESSH